MTVPSTKRPARVLLVDDYAPIRRCLAELIDVESDLEVCGEAESPAEALELLQATRPDVALIDLSLKDGDGLDLVRAIVARGASVKMLVLSMHDEASHAGSALRAGAAGYLVKTEASDRLVDLIRRTLAGES
jgi:DNA-binding NarL/FixJ family response regulator